MRTLLAIVAILVGGGTARAQDIGALLKASRWAEAEAAAARLADPIAPRLVAFYRLLAPRGGTVTALDEFRARNPDWPQQPALRHRREEALAAEPDDATAAAACAREAPQAYQALIRCAEALRDQGQGDDAARAARAAWVAAPPDSAWEAGFLRGWEGVLSPAEQWQRFDRLAWSDTAAAARVIAALQPGDRARAEARLAFRRDDKQAPALLAALPETQQAEPALLLEQVRWLRRARRDAEARDLLLASGMAAERGIDAERRPAFWDERNVLARRRLRDGDPAGAHALCARTGQSAPEPVGDAAFLAGWIALRRLEQPDEARRQFLRLASVSRAAISQARAHYWLARVAASTGDADAARREDQAAADLPTTYYGQLAARAEGETTERVAARIARAREPRWTSTQSTDFVAQDLVRAAMLLTALGEPGRAAGFLQRLADLLDDPADAAMLGRLAIDIGMPQTAVALARRAGRAGTVLPESGWPLAARIPLDGPVDPALALALIRQESSFDPGTISPAGARGLMQLMPATATQQARDLGLEAPLAALTSDAGLNVRLGSAYLAGLLRRFDDSVPLALAAYNAGPGRVAEWLAANGDPRTSAIDMTDWIELIPLGETRNYVQRVMENVAVYRVRLAGAQPQGAPSWPRSPA